jgi:hypothetical protein
MAMPMGAEQRWCLPRSPDRSTLGPQLGTKMTRPSRSGTASRTPGSIECGDTGDVPNDPFPPVPARTYIRERGLRRTQTRVCAWCDAAVTARRSSLTPPKEAAMTRRVSGATTRAGSRAVKDVDLKLEAVIIPVSMSIARRSSTGASGGGSMRTSRSITASGASSSHRPARGVRFNSARTSRRPRPARPGAFTLSSPTSGLRSLSSGTSAPPAWVTPGTRATSRSFHGCNKRAT